MTATTPLPPQPARPERGAWDSVRSGWRQVYGSFEQLGVSVETLDFRADRELDWGRSFHPDSVELCLNVTGRAEVTQAQKATEFRPNTAAAYAVADEPLQGTRAAGEAHRFVTIEFSREYLSRHLAGAESKVDPVVQRSVFGSRAQSAVGAPRLLTDAHRSLARGFMEPPVPPGALPLWYQSKVLEAVSVFLFAGEKQELFCARQKRLGNDRVERVREILRARMEEPPGLEELGREVGVSPFYLSRIFSQETGMTIPQYLRRIRMERAAELLREGRHNVTEAAFAVGYSSLGHFSKSFCEVIGCCPTLYPQARNLARKR